MQPSDRHTAVRLSEKMARFVQRNVLWLLIGCYVLASLLPTPGQAMHQWQWGPSFIGQVPHLLPLLLLALLLFCAAVVTNVPQVRSVLQHPAALILGLLAVWLGPALLVMAAGWIVPWAVDGRSTTGLLVGLALVATMPVANSSVGWSQNAGGNLALSLGLVLVSISLSPWTTPHLLGLLGLSLSPEERALCEALVARFSGTFFIVWVILPTAAGFAARFLAGARRVTSANGLIVLVSTAALLLLNYVNAALALPMVWQQPRPAVLLATTCLAVALSAVGLAGGWLLALLLRQSSDVRSALLFGLSMKHTGLALLLAGAVLADQPLAILMIVLATLVQHLLAGFTQWALQHPSSTLPPDAE